MAEVEVREERLPGVGWRYELPTAEQRLVLVVEDDGPRHLILIEPDDEDPTCQVELSPSVADALAALLSSTRIKTIPADEPSPGRG